MALTASLVELGLFSDEQVIEYTHWLLDKSIYDDELLNILDDDPLYPRDKKASFKRAMINLGFPSVSIEQAKWLYSYFIIHNYAIKPNNYDIFKVTKTSVYLAFEQFLNEYSMLRDTSDFKNIIYRLDDACDNVAVGYVKQGYNDPDTILTMQREFFQLCEDWLSRNRTKIEKIFAEIYG